MSELSSTTAVGIEAVEWLDGGNGNLLVQVTGRWRRRRPVSTAQVTLVIESEGRRHRFPATPEPPSVGGTAPGMWRLSFSVPGWLAPALGGHIWLSLGTVTVPLPAPGVAGPGPEPTTAQTESPVEPQLPPPEPEPDRAPAPGPELAPRVTELEHRLAVAHSERDVLERTLTEARSRGEELERALTGLRSRQEELQSALGDARSESEQLTASRAEGERARRVAEQRAHAEQALRRDLARQLATAERETERAREAMGDLAAAEDRIRTLERELRDARRRGDEAEQIAAAAAARARAHPREHEHEHDHDPSPAAAAPPAASSATAPAPRDSEAARMRFERQLRARRSAGGVRVPVEPWGGLVTPPPVDAPAPASAGPGPPPASAGAGPPPGDGPAAPPPPAAVGAAPPPAAVGTELPRRAELPPVPADSLVDTLRRELDARAAGDAALRSRLVAAETRLAARMLLERRSTEILGRLSEELETLRAALAQERERREAAERKAGVLEQERRARAEAEQRAHDLHLQLTGQRERSRAARDAIGELRGALDRLAPGAATDASAPAPPADPPAPVPAPVPAHDAGPVQADRLSDALSRLREAVAAPVQADPEPASRSVALSASGRTLESAFRRLVKRDAPAAGELLLDLLTLQRAVYPHPIAYDLVLGPGRGCIRVTVGEGPPSIERHGAARTREEIDFRVQGEPARIARLLIAHGIWRRLGLRVARVRGRREGLAALDALLTLPIDLAALGDAGAALRPGSILALVAAMVDPAWTAGERFVIAHQDPDEHGTTYLEARDGKALAIGRIAPAGRIAATITGPADALVTVLTGGASDAAQIAGDGGPLASLRAWVKRAQSG